MSIADWVLGIVLLTVIASQIWALNALAALMDRMDNADGREMDRRRREQDLLKRLADLEAAELVREIEREVRDEP